MGDVRFDDGAHLGCGQGDGRGVFGCGQELFEFGDGVVRGDGVRGGVGVGVGGVGGGEEGGDVEAGEGGGCLAVAFAGAEFGGDCCGAAGVSGIGGGGGGGDGEVGGLAFFDGGGGDEFLEVGRCGGAEGVGGVGEAGEDFVGWGDGFGGVDGAPADGLVDAVEDGGESVFHAHVFGWLSGGCQSVGCWWRVRSALPFVVCAECGEIHSVDVVAHLFFQSIAGEVTVFL